MAEVRPFRGIRYSPSVVRGLSGVVCPPYDTISPREAETLRCRSPYNAVNLELAVAGPEAEPDSDRYARAAALFLRWLDQEVLLREPHPAMYLLDEEFSFGGIERRRRGVVAALRLQEYDKGIVLPHEHTRPGPKADRLALLRAARCNFSSIMSLYRDSDRAVERLLDGARQAEPTLSAHLAAPYRYRLWTVTGPQLLSEIADAMALRQVFLADGHHRYEAALRYRDELEDMEGPLSANAAARYVMMTFIPLDDPGLLVLPHHRLLGGLSDSDLASLRDGLEQEFHLEPLGVPTASAEEAARAVDERLSACSPDELAVAAVGLEQGQAHLLTQRESPHAPGSDSPVLEACDTWILHHKAITPALGEQVESAAVSFVHDTVAAVESVLSGESQVAFLLRSLSMELFEEVMRQGKRLPPKSTCFYPKLPTGLVFNTLDAEV